MNKFFISIFLFFTLFFCSCGNDDGPKNTNKPSIDGHDYVDLGLSVKWASCNVGANSPEEPGDLFFIGYPPQGVNVKNYTPGDPSLPNNIWGSKWRMPTRAEIQELISKCIYEVVFINGTKVGKLTAANGNYILLPFNPKLTNIQSANYLGSTLNEDYDELFGFYISDRSVSESCSVIGGLEFDYNRTDLIRPVSNY